MTYTVMGRCRETGAIGCALTTASINASRVAPHAKGLLPTLREDGVIVSSQSLCNPILAYKAFELVGQGASFDEIQREFESHDQYLSYRQVGIVKASGDVWAYTGDNCFPEKSHELGDGWLVMGNALAKDTVPAMAESMRQGNGKELAECLLLALEAGRDAGGQQWEGQAIPEFYAGMVVYDGKHPFPAVDLRIDFDLEALGKLRRLYDNIHVGGDNYYATMYQAPDTFNESTMAFAFDLASKQIRGAKLATRLAGA